MTHTLESHHKTRHRCSPAIFVPALLALFVALFCSRAAIAQTPPPLRVDVTFQVNQTTSLGQSVFVLGSLPELGNNDMRFAVKLEPASYPAWKATISLPAGRSYTYQYVLRNDAPGQGGNASNGTPIGSVLSASTPAPTPGPAISSRAIIALTTTNDPQVWWRFSGSGSAFTAAPMARVGPGRAAVSGESRWAAWDVGLDSTSAAANRAIEFYFARADGSQRSPASGIYSLLTGGVIVQDQNVFTYPPATSLTTWRRDYDPASPPGLNAPELNNEFRRYRVLLPRGYDQHTTRRYPVIYLHDGQNVFESGPFGTWSAHTSAGELVRVGQMRECIMVGVDNGPNRLSDYSAPDAGGNAANYVAFLRNRLKPLIDANYRTLTSPADTGAIGSSMGGQVSLYMGWDFASTYGRIGAFSGAWSVFTSGFYNRVRTASVKPPIRLYIDSGDAGTSNDNYWPTFNLRDALLSKAAPNAWTLESELRHAVGFGQQHNEAAWAARLPASLIYLFPAFEESQPSTGLGGFASGALFDVNADGVTDVEDAYVFAASPASGSSLPDLNLDGATGTDAGVAPAYDDLAALLAYLRRK